MPLKSAIPIHPIIAHGISSRSVHGKIEVNENGILFHTTSTKDIFAQIQNNPKAELCFQAYGTQIRVTGVLESVEDEKLREEIFQHPVRQFLQAWKEQGIDGLLRIFRMKNGSAVLWTMDTNFDEKQAIRL